MTVEPANSVTRSGLNIPHQAVPYILFQRTHYLRFPVAPVYRFLHRIGLRRTPLYNLVVAFEARLAPKRVKALYASEMLREYQSIKAALPSTCSALLDIGAGVAGIDVLLYRHYQDQHPHLYLLDKSHVDKQVFYLYYQQSAFYNSLATAQSLLVDNGVPETAIHLLEAQARQQIALDRNLDLVVSLLSWGFHYPVHTYVEQVAERLNKQGVLILDIRKGTRGIEQLRPFFRRIDKIIETAKYDRVVARK